MVPRLQLFWAERRSAMNSDPIRGKSVTWTFDDGSMGGKTFEHTFKPDGTVTWKCTDGSMNGASQYETARVSEHVHAVAYLTDHGFTLTTILNFEDNSMVSFASNEKQLMMQHGSFELVRRAA
jgi:hypothetical protein